MKHQVMGAYRWLGVETNIGIRWRCAVSITVL